jgi:hypothetical protein
VVARGGGNLRVAIVVIDDRLPSDRTAPHRAAPPGGPEVAVRTAVKTLTGMTTDVFPRENCIAPAIALIVWTTNTKKYV